MIGMSTLSSLKSPRLWVLGLLAVGGLMAGLFLYRRHTGDEVRISRDICLSAVKQNYGDLFYQVTSAAA